jgi:hypothetical protein
MNERIKELENQCWVQVPCDMDMDAGGLSTIRTVFDRTKFAELIVRECCEVAHCNFHVDGLTLGGILKEHFGVEE